MKKSEQVVKYSVLEMALHEYPLLNHLGGKKTDS